MKNANCIRFQNKNQLLSQTGKYNNITYCYPSILTKVYNFSSSSNGPNNDQPDHHFYEDFDESSDGEEELKEDKKEI